MLLQDKEGQNNYMMQEPDEIEECPPWYTSITCMGICLLWDTLIHIAVYDSFDIYPLCM